MADKALVYRVSFDGLDKQIDAIGKVDRELSNLTATVKKDRAELEMLERTNQKNTQRYADLTNELGKNIVQQRNLTKQKGDLIRETQNEAKVNQENEGSIVSLRAQLSNLTKEYNNLSKAERESAKGKDVQNQAKAISDELKKLESAVGNTSRNVGNYKDALGELEKNLKQLIIAQAAARKSGQENNAVFVANEAAIQALAEEYQALSQSEKEVDDQLKSLTQSGNEAGASAESLKSKLLRLKEAAAEAGEGTEDFKRLTAEAAKLQDAIDDANDAIKQEKGTEFEKFREQLGGVGQSLGNLDFKQANERITQLGGTLKGLTFSSLKEGVKGATSSFSAFGKVLLSNPIFLIAAIVAAVGIALFALKDKVKIIGQAFEVLTAPIRLTIQAFKDLGDAIGITSFQAEAAAEKTNKALDNELKYLNDYVKQVANNYDLQIKLNKALGVETKAIERAKLKFLQESAKKELDIQKDKLEALNKLILEGTTDVVSDEEKQKVQELKDIILSLEIAYKNASTELVLFNVEQTKLANNLKNNKFDVGSIADLNEQLSKLQNLAQNTSDISKLKQLQEQIKQLEVRISSLKNLATNLGDEVIIEPEIIVKPVTTDEDVDDYIKELEAKFQERLAATEPIIEPIKTDAEVKDERVAELQENVDQANAVFEIAQNSFNALAALKDQESQKNIDRINAERDAQLKAVQDSTLSEEAKAQKIAEINKNAEAKAAAERKKNAESQKRLALIQIALDTGKAIAAAIATGAATAPFPANLAAIASGVAAVLAGIVNATAAVNSAKFALGGEIPKGGGFITGNSHAQGGVKFSAGGRLMEAEGGEIIVNKNIQKRPDFVSAISQMNYLTGGKRFEVGGIVAPKFSAAGVSLASQQQQLGGQNFTVEVPAMQVLNNVVDTTSQQSSIIQIQNQTTIGG